MEGVTLANEVLSGRAEGGFDVQRERAQAPPAGALEHGQLQDVLVQVHGDVRPQLIREVVEELDVDMIICKRHYICILCSICIYTIAIISLTRTNANYSPKLF